MLRTKPRFSARAANALNHWATGAVLRVLCVSGIVGWQVSCKYLLPTWDCPLQFLPVLLGTEKQNKQTKIKDHIILKEFKLSTFPHNLIFQIISKRIFSNPRSSGFSAVLLWWLVLSSLQNPERWASGAYAGLPWLRWGAKPTLCGQCHSLAGILVYRVGEGGWTALSHGSLLTVDEMWPATVNSCCCLNLPPQCTLELWDRRNCVSLKMLCQTIAQQHWEDSWGLDCVPGLE